MAKANDLKIDIVDTDIKSPSPEYLKLNKLGKVPTFVGSDGYVLYECIAIAIYGKSGELVLSWAVASSRPCVMI